MAAIAFDLADEVLDSAEVSDTIQINAFQKKAIWTVEIPEEGIYSYVVTEVTRDGMTLKEQAEARKKSRSLERTKVYRVEGPVRGKLMPLSVKAFGGFPSLGHVFAENPDAAEVKLMPLIADTIEVIGAGVIIAASPRERYETLENLAIDVDEVEETIALAEAEDDRETVRALRRAVRLGEKRLAAITKGKEKKKEEGQVSLF